MAPCLEQLVSRRPAMLRHYPKSMSFIVDQRGFACNAAHCFAILI